MKVAKSVEEEREIAIGNIGPKIKKLRKKAKMTQRALADIACVSNRTVSKWEKGTSSPDYGALRAMAKVFDVKVSYFLDDTTARSKIKIFIKDLSDKFKKKGYKAIRFISFVLLIAYFVMTIKSFAVYEIVSNDSNLTFESGYYTKSNFKIIININNITYTSEENDKDIISQKIKLCTLDNNEKVCFYESENMEDIDYKNFVGYNLSRKAARNLDNDLYLVVETIYSDNTVKDYEKKLSMKKIIGSDLVIYPKVDSNVIKSNSDNMHNINNFILDNNGYTKIENTKTYYKQFKDYILYFDLGAEKMTYTIKVKNGIENYSYFYNQNTIEFSLNDLNDTIKTKYTFIKNENKNICNIGNCSDYLKVYDEIIAVFNKAFS